MRNTHVVCKITDKRHKIVISNSRNVNISYIFVKIYAYENPHKYNVCAGFIVIYCILNMHKSE
nr:MAG TPA: hypothetical protein [Caudoviricetes sp.]